MSDIDQVKEAMMEAMAEAALGGHDLAEWGEVGNGWQVECKGCHLTTWVGRNGLRYCLLGGVCPESNLEQRIKRGSYWRGWG